MPTYSYECKECGHVTDEFHAMSAKPRVKCAQCGSTRTKKLLGTGAGIIFKGSGFYETDYKRNGSGGKSKSSGKSESKADTKTDSKTASSSESKKSSTGGSNGSSKD